MVVHKVVVVGDTRCGKTHLLYVLLKKHYPDSDTMVSGLFENTKINIEVDEKTVQLDLWDTRGSEEFDRITASTYVGADLIMVCFAIDSPESLRNVSNKWIPEIKHFCPRIPFILVGNKKDVRNKTLKEKQDYGEDEEAVTFDQGREIANEVRAKSYIECSSLENDGVLNVFETACRIAQLPKPNIRESKCKIM